MSELAGVQQLCCAVQCSGGGQGGRRQQECLLHINTARTLLLAPPTSRHWPRRSWGRWWHGWRGWWRSPWPPWSPRPAPRAAPSWPEVRETLLTTVMSSHCIVLSSLNLDINLTSCGQKRRKHVPSYIYQIFLQTGREVLYNFCGVNQFSILYQQKHPGVPRRLRSHSIRVPVHIWIFGLMYSKMMLIKIDCLWYRQEMLMLL